MKSNLKRAGMLLTGILVSGRLLAQTVDTTHASTDYVKPFSGDGAFRTWSIGAHVGILSPNTLFRSNLKQDFTSPDGNLGYGAYIKDQVLPSFGIQANFLMGKLSGEGAQADASGISSFKTKIHYAVDLSGNLTLANINWHYNRTFMQPYITLGVGSMNYTPVITTPGGTTNFRTDNGGSINELYVPAGFGIKFNVAPGVNLDLGYQVNFVYSDNLDGFKYGSNDDKFSYGHIGLEFALGSRSKPQLATHNPVSSMRTEYLWENRNTKNQLEAEINAQNAQIAAEKAANDKLRADLDATNANLAKFTMDSDGDGVADFYDKCPNTPAGTKVDGAGCPLPVNKPDVKVYITKEDRQVVSTAVKNLEFEFNKATIRPHSFASLDRLAALLIEKKFNLKLAGYTDNVGSQAFNLGLSKDRAAAVKDYLVSKGVAEGQIQAEGYGKEHPIATNRTAKGRQINRRVEFTLF